MKKLFLKLLLALCIMMATILPAVSFNVSAADTALTSGATIASDTTYTISNAEELGYLAAIVNGGQDCSGATFKLTGNINLNVGMTFNTDGTYSGGTPTPWTPIGSLTNSFKGTFDGDGHTVSGIYINDENRNYQGLFGRVITGTVENVGVVNSYVYGSNYVGGVAGFLNGTINSCYNAGSVRGIIYTGGVAGNLNGTVTNCYNTGSVTNNHQYVGGVSGGSDGTFTNCYNTGIITGSGQVGGVVGTNSSATLNNCYNSGNISGHNYVGGVLGQSYSTTPITSCYNIGNVTGKYYVGGVEGKSFAIAGITRCYNTGNVTANLSGSQYVGGVIGENSAGTITECYNAGSVTCNTSNNCGGIVGLLTGGSVVSSFYDKQMCTFDGINDSDVAGQAEGKLTTEMTGGGIFSDLACWVTDTNLYPRLAGMDTTDTAYVSVTPVLLDSGDTVSSVTKNFTVGTGNSVGWTSDNPSVISIADKDASIVPGGTAVLTATRGTVSKTVTLKVPNVFITLKKDGVVWTDSGYSLKLCKGGNAGNEPYLDLEDTDTGIYNAAVENTNYAFYDGSTTSGFTPLQLGVVEVNAGSTGNSTVDYYSVYYTENHVSFSPKPIVILGGKGLILSLSADSGYTLPAFISVTMVGQNSMTLAASAADVDETGEYYYDATTGEIIIAKVTGAVSISAGLSSNAGMSTVLTKTVSTGAEAGTASAPKTASINVANTVASVTAADILPIDAGATVIFYGTDCTFGTPSAGSVSLTAGSGTVMYVKVTAADSTALYYAITINRAATSGSGSGGSGASGSGGSTAAAGGAPVIVNKVSYLSGTSQNIIEDGKTVTQVTVDTGKLQTILAAKGQNASVVIPVATQSQVAAGVLTGQMVKNMETKEATLELKTNSTTYKLPASEIDIEAVSKRLGASVALSDIQVKVQIAEPSDTTVKVVKNMAASNSFSIMIPAVEFSISCTNNGNTAAVSSFNSYVERTIAVPDGVDPTKITTGIVVNADGTTRHVPTKVTVVNGKYYAVINSLTNSTYAVIWHPIEFADVTKHWAKGAVNDMGSRMVVNGVDGANYAPDRDITRAEFATIVVRALGLAPGTGEKTFGDVAVSDWYCSYIKTASSYGIVNGYDTTTFGPNDKITREQAMTMIARAMKITRLDAALTDSEMVTLLASYTDSADASVYAQSSVAACLKTGVITGRSSTTVVPKDNITRAEVAVIVQRLLQKSQLI